ncbi:MAG: lipoprotein [Gammaproteobacteria bacterium]|nr:lipoprotein [Gammaproteobacteria bacterium]
MNIKAQFSFSSIACMLALLIVGCGQKGDLYLPDTEADNKKAVAVKAELKKIADEKNQTNKLN